MRVVVGGVGGNKVFASWRALFISVENELYIFV